MNSSPNNPVAPQNDVEPSSDLFRQPSSGCLPELLAPAGDWDCARAAVENGADAIYFGLEKFNARMRARNFTEADLPRLMEFLHRRGVKGYVTFNTLVFANELAEAEQYLRAIISAGVDAAIVQDIGICRLIRQLSPDFPIHASTQMTITSAGGVEFARELGCNLVVLARECSLKEIERIQTSQLEAGGRWQVAGRPAGSGNNAQPATHNPPLPLEVFVHGALCVAYSGQCLTSEALGGRSANRGECAQACRMPYELVSDGQPVPLGDRRYLLSPQDLAGLDVLPELIRAGVASLKIEGRLKSPEYVANITRVYRQALDELRFGKDDLRTAGYPLRKSEIVNRKYAMEMAFSRGLHTGWFRGINNQELVHARFGKKRGVYLGNVTRVHGERVFVELHAHLKAGDGVVFDAGHPEDKEEGGRVYEVKTGQASRPPVPTARNNARRPLTDGDPHPDPLPSDGRGNSQIRLSHLPKRLDTPTDGGGFSLSHPMGEGRSEGKSGLKSEVVFAPVCELELRFGHGDVDVSRIHVGDKVWKTSDPELDRRLRTTFEGDQPKFQRPIRMEVHGRIDQPLTLIVRDEIGHVVQVASTLPLAAAEKQPLTIERLRQQLGRLGGTAFKLGELTNHLERDVMLPVSELNRLRRDAVSRLEALRAQPKRWTLSVLPASRVFSVYDECPPAHEPGANQPTPDPSQEGNWPTDVGPLLGGAGGGFKGAMRAYNSGNSLPASDERGEGRGGGIPNITPPCSLLSPALSSPRGGEGEENGAALNTDPASGRQTRDVGSGRTREAQLVVLVRNLAQLKAALRCGVRTLYCEFEDPKKYREAVELVKTAGSRGLSPSNNNYQPPTLFVAPPRIFKTGEEWILNQVRSCDADGYLIRNYDHLKFFAGCRCVGDFSLNVANPLTADYFVNRYGLERVTASYDLNIAQLEALLQSAPPDWFEITIHQHMPMFHMEHCVFCAFLSQGTDYTNCGRPCDTHDVQLRDRVGALHSLKADAGCRNTVFNALAQTGAEFVSRMRAQGARRFRIEFLNETPGQLERTLDKYHQLLRGEIAGTELWRDLKLLNKLGVTRGPVHKD